MSSMMIDEIWNWKCSSWSEANKVQRMAAVANSNSNFISSLFLFLVPIQCFISKQSNERGTVVVVFVLGLRIYLTNIYFHAQQQFEQANTDVVEMYISQIDDYPLEWPDNSWCKLPMWVTKFHVQEAQICDCFQRQAGE